MPGYVFCSVTSAWNKIFLMAFYHKKNGRSKYRMYEEKEMWNFLYRQLKQGKSVAFKPKGNALWQELELSGRINKSASSMTTHFRRHMYDRIEYAPLSLKHLLFIAYKLSMTLRKTQIEWIESKFGAQILLSANTIIGYEANGQRYYFEFPDSEKDSDDSACEMEVDAISSLNDSEKYVSDESRLTSRCKRPDRSVEACSWFFSESMKLCSKNSPDSNEFHDISCSPNTNVDSHENGDIGCEAWASDLHLCIQKVEVNDDDRLEAESSEDGNIQLINEIEKERECMMVGMEQLEIFSGIEKAASIAMLARLTKEAKELKVNLLDLINRYISSEK